MPKDVADRIDAVFGGGRVEIYLRVVGVVSVVAFVVLAAFDASDKILYLPLVAAFVGLLGSRVISAVRRRRR